MANGATALGLALLLALTFSPAAQAASISDLLNRPELQPFIAKVMGINECLSDPALPSFDLEQCPSLQRLLDALQLGNKNPAIPPCEMSCLQQFAKLSEICVRELRDAFSGDTTSSVGPLATAWFETCDELLQVDAGGPSPSMAPGPAPTLAPSPAVSPTPEPAETPVPTPAPALAPQNGVVAAMPSALLALAATAAYMLL